MSTVIQVEDLSPDQTYYFAVTAYNTGKLESDRSNEVSFTVPTTLSPLRPQPFSLSLAEDSSAALTLTAECDDASRLAAPLTFTITTPPAHGVLSGTCPNHVYTPNPDYAGPDSFQYTVEDGSQTSTPVAVSIIVTPVNDLPVASGSSLSVTAGSSVSVLLTASDVENDPLTFAITKAPLGGSLSGSGANRTYTARSDFSGTDSFEFTAHDGKGASAAARVTVQVEPRPNQVPTALAQNLSLNEDGSLAILLSGTDLDGDPLSYSLTVPPSQGTVSGTPPSITYRPNPNYNGTDRIAFTVSDGKATSSAANISLTIKSVNDLPVATGSSLSVTAGSSVSVLLAASDVENDPLTFAITKAPLGGSLSGSGANRTYTARSDFSGTDSFEFTAHDGKGTSAAARVTVQVEPRPNQVPTALAQTLSLDEDGSLAILLSGTDLDGDPLSYSLTVPPSQGTVSGTPPSITYRPNPNYNGTDRIAFTVSDGKATSSAANISLTIKSVNDLPVATGSSLSVTAGSSVSVLLAASDVENDPLTFAITKAPLGGSLSGSGANRTYTARSDFSGTDSFEFTAHDGNGTSAAARVTVQVEPRPNQVPTALAQTLSLDEDGSLAILLSGTDLDGDPLSYSLTVPPSQGTVSGTPPSITYRPNPNYNGTDRIAFTVSDGKATSSAANISLTIKSVNDLPVATGSSLSVTAGSSVSVLLAASDVENDPLTFAITKAPLGGSLSGSGANRTYTARSDFSGTDSFEFTAHDGKGASAPARITIEVIAQSRPNTPPVAIAQSVKLNEDIPLPITLGGSDKENQALTYAVTRAPQNGTLSGVPPVLTYTPNANFNGTDSFEFTAHDGLTNSSPALVSLTITAVNDAPVAHELSASVAEETSVLLALTGSDVEGSPLTFTITKQPANGRLFGLAPSIRYAPKNNFNGTDSFEFTVKDGALTSAPAKVLITVTPVNDVPIANKRGHTLAEDRTYSFVLTGTDADQDPLSFAIAEYPTNGTITGTPPNLVYTPNADYFGTDAMKFTVSDGIATSLPADVTFTILAVNDMPVPLGATVTLAKNSSKSFELQGTDVEQSPLTFIIQSNPAYGDLSGTPPYLTYTPKSGFVGTDSLVFSVNDGLLNSTYAEVTFVVKSQRELSADTLLVAAFGTATHLIDGADSLAANDGTDGTAQLEVSQAPQHGVVTLTPDGRFTYRHTGGAASEDTFSYVSIEDGIASAPVQVHVHVFRLTSLVRETTEMVMSFPVVPGVVYQVQGNLTSWDTSASWENLGEVTSEMVTVAEVPTPAPTDESSRYFRVLATSAAGTLTTEVFGFQRRTVSQGTATFTPTFQGTWLGRLQVASAAGNTLRIASSCLAPGQCSPQGPLASHVLINADGSQWWPILDNQPDSLTVDSRGADLASLVQAGESFEIIRLANALDLFGNPASTNRSLQAGDFVDFVNGNGTVSTLECREETPNAVTYHLHENGTDLGPIDASSVTFLDGQPIQIQKAGTSGELWFLGRVQVSPLTPYRVGDTGTGVLVLE